MVPPDGDRKGKTDAGFAFQWALKDSADIKIFYNTFFSIKIFLVKTIKNKNKKSLNMTRNSYFHNFN